MSLRCFFKFFVSNQRGVKFEWYCNLCLTSLYLIYVFFWQRERERNCTLTDSSTRALLQTKIPKMMQLMTEKNTPLTFVNDLAYGKYNAAYVCRMVTVCWSIINESVSATMNFFCVCVRCKKIACTNYSCVRSYDVRATNYGLSNCRLIKINKYSGRASKHIKLWLT